MQRTNAGILDTTIKFGYTSESSSVSDVRESTPFAGVSAFVNALRKPDTNPNRNDTFHFNTLDLDDLMDEGSVAELIDPESILYRRHKSTHPSMVDSAALQKLKESTYSDIHCNDKADRLHDPYELGITEKVMSSAQMHEIIAFCMKEKKIKDDACKMNNLPLETMETHLHECLEKRYKSGDEREIRSWFYALFKAIKKYGPSDCDAIVFGKMLQNVIPESFANVQLVLKNKAERAIKNAVISDIWAARLQNGIPMDIYQSVASQLFIQRDVEDIMKRIKDPVPKSGVKGEACLEALSRNHVRYQHGLEVLLTFNMNLQDDFLAEFNEIFRAIDRSSEGVLNNRQILDLVRRVGNVPSVREGSHAYSLLLDSKSATFRKVRDIKRATYSECVDLFQESNLLANRWLASGQKGTRYQYHEKLKSHLRRDGKEPEQMEGKHITSSRDMLEKGSKCAGECARSVTIEDTGAFRLGT